MLWTAILLGVIWALGLVIGFTGSGLIHILPLLAIAIVLVRLLDGPINVFGGKSSRNC